MKYRSLTIVIIFVALFSSCKFENNTHLESPIIPRPRTMFPVPSSFAITDETKILLDSEDERLLQMAEQLKSLIDSVGHYNMGIIRLKDAEDLNNVILLSTTNTPKRIGKEGYHLKVDKDKLIIQGNDFGGVFNGIMTLSQMILLKELDDGKEGIEIPDVQIWDEPRFAYRGMHLDVGRHFFPVSFVKKYLRIMALYKFNHFHWHLTEDQGWRIEIKAYPKLTEIGAWRIEKNGDKYGGYYTQEEIKEVVAYAKNLNITVIPEIELPGHSRAALAAYPNLSCTGKQQEVPNRWGVFQDVYCAGNEETFVFMQNVLDEVMEMFPGEYIHIGGDECPKDRWEVCEKCQKRIKTEGLEDEHHLQSYFIERIEKYLNAHGRQIIGWDEILEGGLAPEATVMSWRGEKGGIEAARQEHQVIMTPNSHCYFDHYQADPNYEPKAIGGFLPLTKVYDYEPIPTDLTEEQAAYIWGAQANMWTEYMPTSDYVEYMLLPRMIALSEVLWSRRSYKDFDDFNERLQTHKKLLKILGYQYFDGSYLIQLETIYDTVEHQNMAVFHAEQYEPEIRYTLDNTLPNDSSLLYENSFVLDTSVTISAAIFEDKELKREASVFVYEHHYAVGKKMLLKKKPSSRYEGKNKNTLNDGLYGSLNLSDGNWLGFEGKDLIAEIDLGEEYHLKHLSFSYINKPEQWILPPKAITIYKSDDGDRYMEYNRMEINTSDQSFDDVRERVSFPLPDKPTRYLKIIIENQSKLPDNHPHAGNDCWLFVDEIVIE